MRLAAITLASALAATSTPMPVSSSTVHHNPRANKLCAYGPGQARWDVKTSLPAGSDPGQYSEVDARDLTYAPDLEVDPQTVAFAQTQFGAVRHASPLNRTLSNTTRASFVAHMRWAIPTRAAGARNLAVAKSPAFFMKLKPVTPAVVQRIHAIVRSSNPEEALPSFFDALLSAELEDDRIPEPVAIGDSQFHEGDIVSTSGYVLKRSCETDDGDFHIDLGKSAKSTACAIVEVPNPTYIASGELRSMVAEAEATAKKLSEGDHITVYGQLFYDVTHSSTAKGPGGGRGVGECAKSLWEIHPVFRIDVE